MSLTLDLSEFTPRMEQYLQITKKTEADALNKKALDVAYRAASATPVATASSVRASLMRDPHLLAALTSLHVRATGRGILKSPLFKEEMEKLIKHRMGSKKYLRSGWAPVIEAFGGTFRGGASAKGIRSYARRATAVGLLAEIVWVTDQPNEAKAEGAEKIADQALQDAIDFVANDMAEYIEDRIARMIS